MAALTTYFQTTDEIAELLEISPVRRSATVDEVQQWIVWWRPSYEIAKQLVPEQIAAMKAGRWWPPTTEKMINEMPPEIAHRRI